MSKIALGTWAWGAGAFGGDSVFGSNTNVENLKPVFDAAMKAGLNLWDTDRLWHGRVGEDSGYAGKGLSQGGGGNQHQVHAAAGRGVREQRGEDGRGLAGAHGAGLHRHLLDSQPDGRGALDARTDSPAEKR